MKTTMQRLIALSLSLALIQSYEVGASDILPNSMSNMNDVVIPNAVPQPMQDSDKIQVYINANCYKTNLRGVSSPLLPEQPGRPNLIEAVISLGSTTADPIEISPAEISQNPKTFVGTLEKAVTVNLQEDGTIVRTEEDPSNHLRFSFTQNGRTLSSKNTSAAFSANRGVATINISFPGAEGFCGGYYSPLMIFFDEKRPLFSNVSSFPLSPFNTKTYWPESKAPGYFLALDKNGDGKIASADELFGSESGEYINGFEALATLDSNKDGIIDKKDEQFDSLLLWKDVNGDGQSQAGELSSIHSKNMEFFSLNYRSNTNQKVGARAELKERSVFSYRDSSGSQRYGKIIDVWFSSPSNGKNKVSVASNKLRN